MFFFGGFLVGGGMGADWWVVGLRGVILAWWRAVLGISPVGWILGRGWWDVGRADDDGPASGRESASTSSIFVINNSNVSAAPGQRVAKGSYYLGRPWGEYAQVVFQRTYLSDVINGAGWRIWYVSIMSELMLVSNLTPRPGTRATRGPRTSCLASTATLGPGRRGRERPSPGSSTRRSPWRRPWEVVLPMPPFMTRNMSESDIIGVVVAYWASLGRVGVTEKSRWVWWKREESIFKSGRRLVHGHRITRPEK